MFKTKLKLEKVAKNEYVLKEPLIYDNYVVPKNFYTDLASIPRILHWLFKPQSKGYTKSSVVHDYLYSLRKFNKFKADLVFLQAMKEEQKGLDGSVRWFLTRYTLFLGVFIFGMFFKKGFFK